MNRVKQRKVDLRQSIRSVMGYRQAMSVKEILVFASSEGDAGYYVCPRCSITLDREFMAYCDRCGQRLGWHGYENARIIFPDNQNELHT